VIGKLDFDNDGNVVTISKDNYGWFGGIKSYGNSKLAGLLWMQELAKKMEEKGIKNVTITSHHPGVFATELSRNSSGARYLRPIFEYVSSWLKMTPKDGATAPLYFATSPEMEGVTNKYYHITKLQELKPFATDTAVAKKTVDRY